MTKTAKLPASALMAARRVAHIPSDGTFTERAGVEEIAANRAGTRFYHWTGWYAGSGNVRRVVTCREITRELAERLAKEIEG